MTRMNGFSRRVMAPGLKGSRDECQIETVGNFAVGTRPPGGRFSVFVVGGFAPPGNGFERIRRTRGDARKAGHHYS